MSESEYGNSLREIASWDLRLDKKMLILERNPTIWDAEK
jgi:hypothetical protein